MATKIKIPTKFNTHGALLPTHIDYYRDRLREKSLGYIVYDIPRIFGELGAVPVEVKYKHGVFDALDGVTDTMWTVTMPSKRLTLGAVLGLDTTVYENSIGGPSTAVLVVQLNMPKEVDSLAITDPAFGRSQFITVFKVKLGFKKLVFMGRGYNESATNPPVWAQVVEF